MLQGAQPNPTMAVVECMKCVHCTRSERAIGRWNYHCAISSHQGTNSCHDERMHGSQCGPKGLKFEART